MPEHIETLYVHRPLKNADKLIEWATGQGFHSTLTPEDMHVTIAFSRNKVPWHQIAPLQDDLLVPHGGERHMLQFGDAHVLHFDHPHLQDRWGHFRSKGASWDHPSYKPHVTISYEQSEVPLEQIMPYLGPLIFGPEIFNPVKEDWKDNIDEVPLVVENRRVFPLKILGSVKYGKSISMETNRMTELSQLLMKNIDLILEAYDVDEKGNLVAGNKRKIAEADELFHEYFVRSMNTMFRQINENDPIMHQPDGMGLGAHGHDDLGIATNMAHNDISPMGHPNHGGRMNPMMMADENDVTGMYAQHPMHPAMEGTQAGEYDWLFNEDVEDADINEMFDLSEWEDQEEKAEHHGDEHLNEFGDHDAYGMGGSMDMEGGHNDMGGDMGGMAGSGGDNMDLDSSLDHDGGMGGDMMGGGDDGDMITIHGTTDSGGDFEFSFDPETLGFDGEGGGEGHDEHHGHEHHDSGIGHMDEPGMGMGDDDQPPAMAESGEHWHNGKPGKGARGAKSSRMAVVPANPKVGHAAPFPSAMGQRQKH
jgi:hypothetical protein